MAQIGEEKASAGRAIARRIRLAGFALLWENLWPALAPVVAVAAIFVAMAWFDLPALLPGWLHLLVLIGFAAAMVAALIDAALRLRLPRGPVARRRVERESGLAHRPLAALGDTIAAGADDPASVALWHAHLDRMAAAARSLRVGWPKAGWLWRDRYGLRAVIVMALVLGAIDAGPDWAMRLDRAFVPALGRVASGPAASLDIWVNPPEYTGLPPFLLPAEAAPSPIPVPTGSQLLAQVHGAGVVPELVIDNRPANFDKVDDENFKAQATLKEGAKLTVRQGGIRLGQWPIAIVPDLPPNVAFAAPPKQSERGAVRLEYKASDDYGVESVKATMALVDNPGAPPLVLDLALPGLHLKQAHGVGYTDLTANPWAGLPVTIRLAATDALGQEGSSDTVTYTLPERVFHHPVARAIAEQRKELALHPEDREAVADALSDLSLRPNRYGDDTVVFLALRTAQARLRINGDPETIPAVQQLLWDTALRIEDGRAPLMQQDLRQAMQALQDALARNAPDAEIQRLMQQLREAIQRYLQAMMENAQKQGLDSLPQIDPSQMTDGHELSQMLDRAQDLARTGARDAARDLLSQLQDMLESMQLGRMGQMQSGGSRMMGAMQDMMRRQQQLLDQSFRDQRQGHNDEGSAADSQEALRRMLGEMMRRLGENGDIPQALGRAERAMRGAGQALRQGRPGEAIGPQTEALDQLEQGARSLGQKLGRGDGDEYYGEPDSRDPRRQSDRDPFGRKRHNDEANGWVEDGGPLRYGDGPEVDTALRRAKTILEELRRRAGERDRPAIERDYIDRLLKEF
jgi:uncharacterized protein (TIGR02302 family)